MKSPNIIPLSGKTNVEVVVEQLEKLIVDGYWEPEARIWSEAELCDKFNVGRSTVREAINVLKAKNLIYILPGLGTFVSKPSDVDNSFVITHIPDPKSEADLLNIMELRLGLEPINAALAARRGTPEEVEAIRKSFETQRDNMEIATRSFAQNDMEFHQYVAQAAHNPVILDVMNMATNFLKQQQILTSHQVSRRSKATDFHKAIFDAIANRREAVAKSAMYEHMEETYSHVKFLISISKTVSGRLPARKYD